MNTPPHPPGFRSYDFGSLAADLMRGLKQKNFMIKIISYFQERILLKGAVVGL